jgi:adenylate kinase
MINIILLGPPGAGKGTQANKLSDKYKLMHISTGDLIRDEINSNSELGSRLKAFVEKGLLVPDELVVEIIETKLVKAGSGYLLDGFPRNIKQAVALDEIIDKKKLDNPYIFYIYVDDKELIRRLANRLSCPLCKRVYNLVNNPPNHDGLCDCCGVALIKRKDDDEEVIRKRLEVFRNETYPLLDYYSRSDRFYKIDGNTSEDKVFKSIVEIIK